ncbi:MAG: sulfatase-like hydrolase/transferase, partial [Pirellulales bacterium]|nr:sulfatase-like hydrolase/transferase [Pirellulales bacterium]
MKSRLLHKVAAFLLSVVWCLADTATSVVFSSEKLRPPNIVLILMDNLGWGEIGAYGGGILRGGPTDRLDDLAKEGMRLL